MDATVAVEALAAGETGESVSAATYRPQLDGLRAVAVYLVVLFHSRSDLFRGGYIGVDVFFVLSGYLVTQLLLRDISRTGTIGFGRFYSRRFRRLLPAAFVALIVTAAVFTAIAAPAEVIDAAGSFRAAFLYVTNWYFIHQATGYFGANLNVDPVLQFWSLAVEEQFYLLWPLILAALIALTRRMELPRQMRTIRIVVIVGAVASAVWAFSLRVSDPNHAYYGTDTRAYELLAGALIALAPTSLTALRSYARRLRYAGVASIAMLVFLATSAVGLGAIERGIAVTLTTVVLIVALETADGGVVVRALSNRTIVYLGKISYGTYLWHWIVIIVAVRTFHTSVITTVAIDGLVATALASLSYAVLEQPVRLSGLLDRHRAFVIAGGLTLSVVSALVLIPRIVTPANAVTPSVHATTTGFTPIPKGLDWRGVRGNGKFIACDKAPASKCTIRRGHGPTILVIGDSHAMKLVPTFMEIARRNGLTLSVSARAHCPWQRGVPGPGSTVDGPNLTAKGCLAHQEDLYTRVIPALHPDIIVGVTSVYGGENHIAKSTGKSVADLRADGAKVVIAEPTPVAPFDPRVCLSKATSLEQCRYVVSKKPLPIEVAYRRLAKKTKGVYSLNLDPLVCPFLPICDPVVNGQIVKSDPGHLTQKFAESIAPPVEDYLRQIGLLPR